MSIVATKINTPRANLAREVQLLRSFVIGCAGRDSEGNYRPAFVRRVLKALDPLPQHRFTSPRTFLQQLAE